ncbi:hypothetical protein M8J76_001788 [Diaphorina citri]|nr:hypothetical protein M8J76_001788 [Diaphorina citri]
MCEELKLKKLECEAWGFRLTGGRDFGTPLTVLRVTGTSVAEEGGMEVGDMIVSINGQCTQAMTHVEAQQHIIGSGNTLTLQILRGIPVPAPELTTTPLRGVTPNIAFQRCESELTNDSHDLKLTESSFSHLHHQFNEVEPTEEELTEQKIADKMLENAELLEGNVIGVNFKRFIPKVDFIKNSLVYQVLQEEQVYKAKTEEEQLEKCPEKRFSTFLVHPNNAKPKVKKEPCKLPKRPKTPLQPEPEKQEEKKSSQSENPPKPNQPTTEPESKPDDQPKPSEQVDKKESQSEPPKVEEPKVEKTESGKDEKESSIEIQINDETVQASEVIEKTKEIREEATKVEVHEEVVKKTVQELESTPSSVDSTAIKPFTKQEILNAQQELPSIAEVVEETEELTEDTDFNRQLSLIKSQLQSLRQLPSLIETQLNLFQTQIDCLVDLKNKENKLNPDPSQGESQNDQTEAVASDSVPNVTSENQSGTETVPNEHVESSEPDHGIKSEKSVEVQEVREETVQKADAQVTGSVQSGCDSTQPSHDTHTERKSKPKKSSLFSGITPQPRPVVLPGGRIWRKPRDAYNDEFIAETLITQAEVLIGTNTGVNFRKYEPPRFAMSESAVWRLINNIENKSTEVEPANDFYQTPIDEKKIFVAGLHMNPDVSK